MNSACCSLKFFPFCFMYFLKCTLSCFLVICYRQDNEETYKVGERFTLGNCSQSCMCNENGEISCVPMCSKIKCPKRTRPRGKGFVEQKESGCSCEIQECVPGMLIIRQWVPLCLELYHRTTHVAAL